jgi:hypothetical protein
MRPAARIGLVVTALATVCAMALPAGALPAFSKAPKIAADPHPKHLTQLWRVRTGNDTTFDRIVLDERFSPSGYTVKYVKHVIADGSGKRVHLKGRFFLSVSVSNTSTSGAAGTPTFVHQKYNPGLPEVLQIKKTGEFEGVVSFGIGLKKRKGFRVFLLHSPLQLVIDVKH